MTSLLHEVRPALSLFALLTLITGAVYPLAVTGIGMAVFPRQARGSMVERNGAVAGSDLIAQPFDDAKYLWPRPSAVAYNAAASGGSNLAPSNPVLVDAVHDRMTKLSTATVPPDLVTTSASGLDPHVSPAAAEVQADRIAKARGVDASTVRSVIARHTEGRTFGILGQPRVNVLLVNLDLDARSPMTTAASTSWKNRAFDAQ
jgi:potassium-transporting ATPase KdpC subunit